MAAWDDRPGVPHTLWVGVAFGLYLSAMVVLLGIVLWRLWTEVLAGVAL